MTTTFQKRQKEMKRMEKARMKAERRHQKKLAGHAPVEDSQDVSTPVENAEAPAEPEPQT